MGKDLKGKELGVGLYQRADKRYEARAMVNGIKINLYGNNLKQLKEEFEDAKAEAKRGIDQKTKNITMDEWFEEWFAKYRAPFVKDVSITPMKTKYRSIFKPYIGHLKVRDIVSLHIQKVVVAEIEKGRANSSLREAVGLLRRCLESAKNNGITNTNPCFDIQVPWSESNPRLTRFLSPEEINVFLNAAEDDYYKEMYYIMIFTGLRIGEVGGLKWSDIDFRSKCMRLQRALSVEYHKGVKSIKLGTMKTPNSYRTIPFFNGVEENLKAWKDKQDKLKKSLGDRWRSKGEFEDLVFTTTMGSPVTRYIADKQINKVVDKINFERQVRSAQYDEDYVEFQKVYPHALRHTFCSLCFSKNMNPKVVQSIMGHANYSTTIGIYTHMFQEDYDKEVAKFDLEVETGREEAEKEVFQEMIRINKAFKDKQFG